MNIVDIPCDSHMTSFVVALSHVPSIDVQIKAFEDTTDVSHNSDIYCLVNSFISIEWRLFY